MTRSLVVPTVGTGGVKRQSAAAPASGTALCWTPMLRALACVTAAAALVVGVAHAASTTTAARCQPTLSDGAGPFQQGGLTVPRRSKIGTGHVLQGRVL